MSSLVGRTVSHYRILELVGRGGMGAVYRTFPEVDQINYITRVTTPVLMVNGRHDAIEPLESAQLTMFRL